MAMTKEWSEVKDAGAEARVQFELDALSDKVRILKDMAEALRKNELGTMGWQMINLVAQRLDDDLGMLAMDVWKLQPEKPVQPEPVQSNGDIAWVQIPVWRSDMTACSHYDDSDKYEREWYEYLSNGGMNEGYEEEWISTQDFYDVIHAEIMAAIVVTRNSSEDKMLQFNDLSEEAVAWAYELLIDRHYER